ncbi:hypothetical protein MMC07_008883, partial [Pseudocyphellaria aurata]|nr:hypothetical protein [Pseudocyphellaria aurata]
NTESYMICINHRPRLALTTVSANLAHGYSVQSRWTQPQRLRNGSVEQFFNIPKRPSMLSNPVLMPEGYFHGLPAVHKWFTESTNNDSTVARLDQLYLQPFQGVTVPLEFTRQTSKVADDLTFLRAEVPFSIFLAWVTHAQSDTVDRLYLAQASLSALPEELRDDLPTPDLVTQAGKGDIYDANVWMGVAPTYTPLHRDPNPNLLVQLVGQKIVRLLAPKDGQEVFAEVQESIGRTASATFRGEEMMNGKERGLLEARIWDDSDRHGKVQPTGFEVRLGRGDGLYIPQGWWHSVKGTGSGMTASVGKEFL